MSNSLEAMQAEIQQRKEPQTTGPRFKARSVNITGDERQLFMQELRAAFKAQDGGSNDDEIAALWECVGSACAVFDIFQEDTEG